MRTRTKVALVFETIGIVLAALIAGGVISALYGPLAPFAYICCIVYGVYIAIWNVHRVQDNSKYYTEFKVPSREEVKS